MQAVAKANREYPDMELENRDVDPEVVLGKTEAIGSKRQEPIEPSGSRLTACIRKVNGEHGRPLFVGGSRTH